MRGRIRATPRKGKEAKQISRGSPPPRNRLARNSRKPARQSAVRTLCESAIECPLCEKLGETSSSKSICPAIESRARPDSRLQPSSCHSERSRGISGFGLENQRCLDCARHDKQN